MPDCSSFYRKPLHVILDTIPDFLFFFSKAILIDDSLVIKAILAASKADICSLISSINYSTYTGNL